ncbi:hypothetical protein T484DRAFT_1779964 [Baffinella frigidus]|nr:hypothetical protein T484DRAFT_1779964 [Cryptophyta sp. CCMP2293]
MVRPSAGPFRDVSRWVDHGLGISWKVARRQMFLPFKGYPDDGRRQVLTVERLFPGGAAAESRLVLPGDKLVSVEVEGHGMEMMVHGSLSDFKRSLQGVEVASDERRPRVTLELMRAADVCAAQRDLTDPESIGRRPTTTCTMQVKERGATPAVARQPSRPASRRLPSASGAVRPVIGQARQRTPAGLAGSRPASRSALQTPGGTARAGGRPPTTSWQIAVDGDTPQSTRALNAPRFERLVFFVNRRVKDPELLLLLNRSYALDRPQTGVLPPLTAGGSLAGRPALALRACYRLKIWWTPSEQDAIAALLVRLKGGDQPDRMRDILQVIVEHLGAAKEHREQQRRRSSTVAFAAPPSSEPAEVLMVEDDVDDDAIARSNLAFAEDHSSAMVDDMMASFLADCS